MNLGVRKIASLVCSYVLFTSQSFAFRHHPRHFLRNYTFMSASYSLVTSVTCLKPEDFESALAEVEGKQARHTYLLFYASEDPATGRSWCPDCVRAKPLIDEALRKSTESTALLVAFVDRQPYRTPEYLYRTDPRIDLRCVPTLIRWDEGKKVHQLNDVQCQNPDLIEELFTKY